MISGMAMLRVSVRMSVVFPMFRRRVMRLPMVFRMCFSDLFLVVPPFIDLHELIVGERAYF